VKYPTVYDGPGGRPFGREKRTEQAANYPFQRILQNKTAYGKDRQRYALYRKRQLISVLL
jgi:hypothetical protein